MKITSAARNLLFILLGITSTANAGTAGSAANEMTTQTGVIATNIAMGLQETQNNQIEKIATQINTVRAALTKYYSDTYGWPTSLAAMQAAGYYSGTYVTGLGTITGTIAAASTYTLTLTMPAGNVGNIMAKSIAAKTTGTATNNVVTVNVATPTSAVLVQNMLSRIPDPANPNSNKMMQNINMNNFSLQNVNQIDVTKLNVAQDLAVTRNASIGSNLTVGGTATINGATTINNTITASKFVSNGYTLGDSSGKLFYQSQDLDARYLGKTATAVNADKLDNLNSTSFARLDNGTQLFSGDVIASSGGTQYSLIGAYTRLNSLQSSINTINSTLTNHGNRIAALEAWKATCNGNLAACGNVGSLGGGGVKGSLWYDTWDTGMTSPDSSAFGARTYMTNKVLQTRSCPSNYAMHHIESDVNRTVKDGGTTYYYGKARLVCVN